MASPCSTASGHADPMRQRVLRIVALAAMCAIGFSDMYSYSMPDSFLGQVLAAKNTRTSDVMVALGVDGINTCLATVVVLLCQSLPGVSGMSTSAKWWLVVAGQAASVVSSALPAVHPSVEMITCCRALHGAATAVYMVYCLILLVELTPKQHLALGIAVLSAGSSAGDSIGPVLGAVVYDKGGGLRAAFLLQTAVNTASLLLALLVVPVWVWAGNSSSSSSSSNSSSSSFSNSSSSSSPRFIKAGLTVQRSDSSESGTGDCGRLQSKVIDFVLSDTGSPPAAAAEMQSDAWQLAVVIDAGAAAVCSHCREVRPGGCHHRDSGKLHCVDSACDVESGHSATAAAAAQCKTIGCGVDSAELDGKQPNDLQLQLQQQQQQQQRLDMGSVLRTVRDWVVASQCMLVFLEQTVTSTVLVVLPVVMHSPTWLVGVIYVAMVVGAITGPFALEAYLSSRPASKQKTHHLAVGICLVMGVCSTLLIPLSWSIPASACLLFAFGVTQAATETLVYIHVADRLEHLGQHVATHVSMCMYMIALALGAGLGNMLGGALQRERWSVQVGVTCALAGFTSVYGAFISVVMIAAHTEPEQ